MSVQAPNDTLLVNPQANSNRGWRRWKFIALGIVVILMVLAIWWSVILAQNGKRPADTIIGNWLEILVVPIVLVAAAWWLDHYQKQRDEEAAKVQKQREKQAEAAQKRRDQEIAKLRRCNLRGAFMEGAELTDADLSGANLTGADLTDADLSWSLLRNTILDESTRIDSKWQLVWAILNQKLLTTEVEITLSGSDAPQTKPWQEWRQVEEGRFRGPDLSDATLEATNLSSANMSHVYLPNANLSDAWLNGADLRGAKLRGASLRNTNLTDAVLDGADLTFADLTGAIVSRQQLISAMTSGAKLDCRFTDGE